MDSASDRASIDDRGDRASDGDSMLGDTLRGDSLRGDLAVILMDEFGSKATLLCAGLIYSGSLLRFAFFPLLGNLLFDLTFPVRLDFCFFFGTSMTIAERGEGSLRKFVAGPEWPMSPILDFPGDSFLRLMACILDAIRLATSGDPPASLRLFFVVGTRTGHFLLAASP